MLPTCKQVPKMMSKKNDYMQKEFQNFQNFTYTFQNL